MDAHKMANTGMRTKPGLREFLNENEQYAHALEKINQKLALKDAMDRASNAIEQSRKGNDDDAQSRASSHTKYSMATIS